MLLIKNQKLKQKIFILDKILQNIHLIKKNILHQVIQVQIVVIIMDNHYIMLHINVIIIHNDYHQQQQHQIQLVQQIIQVLKVHF